MGLSNRLFPAPPKSSPQIDRRLAQIEASRRELLSLATHQALSKAGIPASWITAETSPAMSARNERGMHLRLVLRQRQPTLIDHGVALQSARSGSHHEA
jgi:hypothetical protein